MYEHSLLRPANNLNGNLETSMQSSMSYNGANHRGICEMKSSIRVFHSLYKIARNGIILIKGFNNSKKKLPPVGLDLMQGIITSLRVHYLTN